MERLQGCGLQGTMIFCEEHTHLFCSACLGVQLQAWNILDALYMVLLHTPDVLHARLLQQWHPDEVPSILPSQLPQKLLNHLDGGLLAMCPPVAVKIAWCLPEHKYELEHTLGAPVLSSTAATE